MLSTPLEVSYFFLSCFLKIILNQPEVCIYYFYKLLVLRSYHAKYRNRKVLSARKSNSTKAPSEQAFWIKKVFFSY